MSKVKSKDTKLEISVRKTLYAKGYRYRLHYQIPGKPDIVLPKLRIAIFVQGCFWHQHNCNKAKRPTSNVDFWNKKLDSNIARDKTFAIQLSELGWNTFYVWECQVKQNKTEVIKNLEKFINEKSNNTS